MPTPVSPPVVLELALREPGDAQTQGNLPLRTLVQRRAEGPRPVLGVWCCSGRGHVPRALSASVRSYADGGPYPSCARPHGRGLQGRRRLPPEPGVRRATRTAARTPAHDSIGDFRSACSSRTAGRSAPAPPRAAHRWRPGVAPARPASPGPRRPTSCPGRPRPTTFFAISPRRPRRRPCRRTLVFTQDADESADQALARIGSFREGSSSGLPSCGL